MSSLPEAQGYLEMGMYEEAWIALDDLPPEDKDRKPVLEIRCRILIATGQWEACQWLAKGLVRDFPAWMEPFVWAAEALDGQGMGQEALEFLLRGESVHEDEPAFLFRLGALQAKLGDVSTAKQTIARLVELAPDWRLKVLEDRDFESVWDSLGRP